MIWILYFTLGIHLFYYLFLFTRLALYNYPVDFSVKSSNLSIVVCFKNEEETIDNLLPILLSQDSDDIVLVDDFSTDNTFDKLSKYKSNRVKIIRASFDRPGKKQAASDGINATKNNRVLFTDSDCIPNSSNWAHEMNTAKSQIVLGYSPNIKHKGLTNLFARFETYMTGVQYLSYALLGIPYMGVGRNMLIDKTLREANLDSIKGNSLASGDDDLTINAIATKHNTSICLTSQSLVYTSAPTNLKKFIIQKTRHISTSVHYRFLHQVLLGAFSGSQILFYLIILLGGIFGTIPLMICFIAYIIKQVVQIVIHSQLIKKMNESIRIHQLLLLDLLLFFYYLVMPFILLIRKNDNRWS